MAPKFLIMHQPGLSGQIYKMQTEENWIEESNNNQKKKNEKEDFCRTVAIRLSVKGKIFLLPVVQSWPTLYMGSECDLLKVIKLFEVLCRDDAQYDSKRERKVWALLNCAIDISQPLPDFYCQSCALCVRVCTQLHIMRKYMVARWL